MDSPSLIIGLTALFALIGVGGSLAYYFARYYVKTDHSDKELLTKKPMDLAATPAPKTAPAPKSLPAQPKTIQQALSKTREGLWGRLLKLNFSSELDSQIRDEIEEILYTSDLGPQTAELLLSTVQEKLTGDEKKSAEAVAGAIRIEMNTILNEVSRSEDLFTKVETSAKPVVWLIVGVNGAGKTTTIGKLANLAKSKGLKPLIVAGDTFRAAADSQLKEWAVRANCEVFSPENVKDPGAVAYSGIERAKAVGADLVIIDTAGRLHTQGHLMAELEKIDRVLGKVLPGSPHEKILVIDANGGQNALSQAREFNKSIGLTGVVITKLDGTSKAGVVIGIAGEFKLPIFYIGVGESLADLRPFEASAFVDAII